MGHRHQQRQGDDDRAESPEIPRRVLRGIRIQLENSAPEIAKCAEFFNATCDELAAGK